jgi:hypothetical protein
VKEKLMRNPGQLGQDQTPVREPVAPTMPLPAPVPTGREIPYDYVARFALTGQRGNRIEEVINVSVEGAFVAVAIGYSFIPAPLPNRDADLVAVGAAAAGRLGRKLTPALFNLGRDFFADPRIILKCLVVRLCGIDFIYSMIDSATGRELQNLPIHNIAGLGEATGKRPFRPLAKPMLFMPRSTIRIVVEEISEDFPYGYEDPRGSGRRVGGQLFIVLQGYKIIGYGASTG